MSNNTVGHLTSNPNINLVTSCENCVELHEVRQYINVIVKSCTRCCKEYAHCKFCDKLCKKVTTGSITANNYEYLTCEESKCNFLGVRCKICHSLCKITMSNQKKNLFWCCDKSRDCKFFKQNVIISLKNHINGCRDLLFMNAETLNKFIFGNIDNIVFIEILKKLYVFEKLTLDDLNLVIDYVREIDSHVSIAISREINDLASPNRQMSNNRNNNYDYYHKSPTTNINKTEVSELINDYEEEMIGIKCFNEFKNKYEKKLQDLENSYKKDLVDFKNNMENSAKKSLNKIKDEFKIFKDETENKFDQIQKQHEKQFTELRENYESIDNNFAILFKNLNISNSDDDSGENNKITKRSKLDDDKSSRIIRKSLRIQNKKPGATSNSARGRRNFKSRGGN